ncbi:MAG: GAF domain-containing protein [Bacteroidales bacterium]|nr:GAF domain-containing protein [Bacteroidales bacterium]
MTYYQSKSRKLFTTGFVLFSITAGLYSQPGNIKFENISIRDGLSQSSPNCIIQDSRGILWIGTEDGLNKYDGYSFVVYKPEVGVTGSISNNRINCIIEAKDGNLWIGTNGGGLNLYDRRTDMFFHHTGSDSDDFKSETINCLYEEDDGTLWAGTLNGLAKIQQSTQSIKTYISNPLQSGTISSDHITCIAADEPGFLWVGTNDGLNRMNTGRESFERYYHDSTDASSISSNSITCFLTDQTNLFWIGTSDGLNLYDHSNDAFERITLPHHNNINGVTENTITALAEDNDGNIWIGTNGNGVDIFIKNINQAINLKYNHNNPYSLSNNEVLSIYRDQSGIIWAGTNGLDKYNSKKEKFTLFNFDPYSSEGLVYRHIHSIYEDDYGVLWIGSKSDGILLLNRAKKVSGRIMMAEDRSSGLSSNKIRVIREHPEGIIWVGTDDNGLNRIALNEERIPSSYEVFRHDPGNFNSLTSNTIYTLYFDEKDNLWIGTDNGISVMNLNTGEIKRHVYNPDNPNGLNNNTAYYIYGDSKGNIWIATDNGINRHLPESDGFSHYVSKDDDPNSLSSNELLTIYEDRNNIIWIGTYAKGINSFNPETEEFNRYEEITGLSTAVVYGILEDSKSYLWLSTNDGIIKFDPSEKSIARHFTIEDGLQSNEFNGGAYFKSVSGEMFFGGQYGFNSFFPNEVSVDTIPPKIILTELKINNKVIAPGKDSPIDCHISEVSEIILNSRQNNFTLSFAALHFANPDGNHYRYMLEGFDKDWIDGGTQRFVSYTSLPYKTYNFRVQAANSDGIWNESGLAVRIKIRPPYHATTGFRFLIVLLIITAVYLIIRGRIREQNRQKEKLQKKIEKNTQELADTKKQLEKQQEEITIQKQEIRLREKEQQDIMWYNEGLNKFSDLMSKNQGDIKKLTQVIINNLIDYVEAEQGGIFLLNDDNPEDIHLQLAASYAYNKERLDARFLIGEGYIGTCFKEKKVIELEHPEKEYTAVRSGLGEEHPKYIIFIPIKMDESVEGVIEVASFKKLKGYKVSFVQKMAETLTSIITSEKATQKMFKIVEQSKLQSEELAAQEETLRQNLEEMSAAHEEASRREDDLIKQAEEFASNETILQEEIESLRSENRKLKEQITSLSKKNKKN